jgi:hypothetical protein
MWEWTPAEGQDQDKLRIRWTTHIGKVNGSQKIGTENWENRMKWRSGIDGW